MLPQAHYTATSLEDIALLFEYFASQSRHSHARRSQDKRRNEIVASVWEDAADILRRTTMKERNDAV